MRWRWPSITLKCTRTVSPALNLGSSVRSCCCSIDSMILLMKRGPGRAGPAGILAEISPAAADPDQRQQSERRRRADERDPVRRPVDEEDLADDLAPGDRPPATRVAGRGAVVAHPEVVPLRDSPGGLRLGVPAVRLDVALGELLAVDVDVSVALRPPLARQ